MVGLVLVSHSNKLAKAALELATKVSENSIPIAYSGGAGDGKELLGTDPTDVMEAIQSVYSEDGVLVLMDLGSAVISARFAIDLLGDEFPHIRLCPAAIVEGAVIAATQISIGGTLEEVYQEAMGALAPKMKEMGIGESESVINTTGDTATTTFTEYFIKVNTENGLHARPAADLAKAVSPFNVNVLISNVSKGSSFVSAKSVNKIALSGVAQGDTIALRIDGDNPDAVYNAVLFAFNGEFISVKSPLYEVTAISSKVVDSAEVGLRVLAKGLGSGTLYLADLSIDKLSPKPINDIPAQLELLQAAILSVKKDILLRKDNFVAKGMKSEANIFDAHILMLQDEDTINEVRQEISSKHIDAAYAYQSKMYELSEEFRKMEQEYLRERASDVMDIANQVLGKLLNINSPSVLEMSDAKVVVVAHEVTPSMISVWGEGQLKGIITEIGGATSHVAIIAKAMGIPAISGYKISKTCRSGDLVLMDTSTQQILINPSDSDKAEFDIRYKQWQDSIGADLLDSQGSANTIDKVNISVAANVGDLNSAKSAVKYGAEGVGLLRTEFLFMDSSHQPTEDEQIKKLADIFACFPDRTVVVRTLDVGGDKHISWLPMEKEDNPFLGVRGVRLYQKHKELFKSQVRSILRAGKGYHIKLMIPMVAVVSEVEFVRDVMNEAHEELLASNTDHLWPIPMGIMVETPSAVFCANELARKVDFFSIGTNDLGQYTMSAERGGVLETLLDPTQPAILRAISAVVKAADRNGVEVSVCGEMAGEPTTAKILISLGVKKLSMSSTSIGKVKKMIRGLQYNAVISGADRLLSAGSAADVKETVKTI